MEPNGPGRLLRVRGGALALLLEDGTVLHQGGARAAMAPERAFAAAGAALVSRSDVLRPRAACPLCDRSSRLSRLAFEVAQAFWSVPFVECGACGLLYKAEIAAPEVLAHVYSKTYQHFVGGADPSSLASRVARLGAPPGRHLDYGCGKGDLVAAARRAGWDSVGADPYLPAEAAEGPGGSHLFRLDACDPGAARALGAFDVVSMWAAFEHLDRPRETVEGLARLLSPGGRLVLNSPNGRSLVARRAGTMWPVAMLVEHLQFLTPRAVRWLADRSGLRVARLRFSGTPYPLGCVPPDAEHQGLPSLPFATAELELPGGDAPAPAVPRRSTRFVSRLREAVLGADGEGALANAARAVIHLFRLGDHLEVVLEAPRRGGRP